MLQKIPGLQFALHLYFHSGHPASSISSQGVMEIVRGFQLRSEQLLKLLKLWR